MKQAECLMVSYQLEGLRYNKIGFRADFLIDFSEEGIRLSIVINGLPRSSDMTMTQEVLAIMVYGLI